MKLKHFALIAAALIMLRWTDARAQVVGAGGDDCRAPDTDAPTSMLWQRVTELVRAVHRDIDARGGQDRGNANPLPWSGMEHELEAVQPACGRSASPVPSLQWLQSTLVRR